MNVYVWVQTLYDCDVYMLKCYLTCSFLGNYICAYAGWIYSHPNCGLDACTIVWCRFAEETQ